MNNLKLAEQCREAAKHLSYNKTNEDRAKHSLLEAAARLERTNQVLNDIILVLRQHSALTTVPAFGKPTIGETLDQLTKG